MMVHTILIPVDFKVESLKSLKLYLNACPHERINVILVYAERSSGSITDLLFYSPSKRVTELCDGIFLEALSMIKNRYDSVIHRIKVELFNGTTAGALNTFIDANGVSEIINPVNYTFQTPNRAFDMRPFFKDAHVPIKEVLWNSQNSLSAHEQLIALFN